MLRWAFAIYTVLVTAAGPGLCCCSLTHLFAGHADRQTATADLPPCCQTSSNGDEQHGQGGCPREKRDDRHQPGCPCRQVEAKAPAALLDRAVEVPDQFQVASPFAVPTLAVPFDGPLGGSGTPALPGGPPPFLTADDLLRVHHQLRC